MLKPHRTSYHTALIPLLIRAQVILDQGDEVMNDPTATLLLQIDTIERDSRALRCVGYATLPLFHDPRISSQPMRHNISDYVLNQVRLAPVAACG